MSAPTDKPVDLGDQLDALGLDPWQRRLLEAIADGTYPPTAAEWFAAARASSKLAAQRLAVAAELAAGGHPHVVSKDATACPGGFCTAEQLRRPRHQRPAIRPIYDEAARLPGPAWAPLADAAEAWRRANPPLPERTNP